MLAVTRVPFTLLRLGLPMPPLAMLETTGRRSGRTHRVPVAVLRSGDEQWLVSPFGETAWVQNLRAGTPARLRRGRRSIGITVVELTADERAVHLRRFRRRFGVIPFVRAAFEATGRDPESAFAAEADRHPVFRVLSAPRETGPSTQ